MGGRIRYAASVFSRANITGTRQQLTDWPLVLGFEMLGNTRFKPAFLKEFGDAKISLRLQDGHRIRLRPFTMDESILREIWIERVYGPNDFLRFSDGETLIDIGAHIGIFARYYASQCPSSRLICYEPMPENFQLLTQNLGYGGCLNSCCYLMAVAGEEGNRKLYLSSSNTGGHSIEGNGNKAIIVAATTLDQLVRRQLPLGGGFLKMDCEGAEYEILSNASSNSFRKFSRIAMEYHVDAKASTSSPAALMSLLESEGFENRLTEQFPKSGLIYANRPAG